jgi:hypothetical protein
MKKIGMILLFMGLIYILIVLPGCSTPEGGSSIPWGRPESWEGEMSVGVPI